MIPHQLPRLVNCPPEGERLAHTLKVSSQSSVLTITTHQAEESTAAGLLGLVDGLPEILEVDVLHTAQTSSQQGAHHQDEEGGEELLRSQRLTGSLLLLLRITSPGQPEPPQSLQVPCLAVVNDLLVEAVEVFGVAGEGEAVAGHGVPAADSEQPALVVLTHQVLQHRPVVQEGVQVADEENYLRTLRGEGGISSYL